MALVSAFSMDYQRLTGITHKAKAHRRSHHGYSAELLYLGSHRSTQLTPKALRTHEAPSGSSIHALVLIGINGAFTSFHSARLLYLVGITCGSGCHGLSARSSINPTPAAHSVCVRRNPLRRL